MKRLVLDGVIVDYVVLRDRRCIFTSVSSDSVSVINATESIIKEIARAEKKDITGLRYFDLQTCLGYLGFDPGDYELNEVTFKMRKGIGVIEDVWWIERKCSHKIREIFKEHIEGRISPNFLQFPR